MNLFSLRWGIPILLSFLPGTTARAQTREAFVTASFTDRRELLIEDLERQEIEILENDTPRRIEFMARDEVPTVYGILFDRSLLLDEEGGYRIGNLPPQLGAGAAKSLAYEMIDKYLGRHTIWVGSYERELRVLLDFSTDGFRAKDAIHSLAAKRTSEETFLYGALFASVMKMKERNEKRRILIVFLSGMDSESAGKLKPLKNLLASCNVEVFFISFAARAGGSMTAMMAQSSIRELAQTTAGEAFMASDYREHPDDISRRILNVLRTYYTFGFQSDSPIDKPGRLAIRCSRAGAKVKARQAAPVF
jgi:VWFA-related protein